MQKKRDARAKLLFCRSKPVAFLPFSLPSPSSLLKPPVVGGNNSLGKVIDPDTGIRKIFVGGIRNPGLWNTEFNSGIRNPSNDWNMKSNFH